MESFPLPAILAFGTLSAVLIFAVVSKYRTEKRRADDNAPKSTLAADAPDRRG